MNRRRINVVYFVTMGLFHKIYDSIKSASSLSFRQGLFYLLSLLLVLVSVNPVQAGMVMGAGMRMNDSSAESAMALSYAFQNNESVADGSAERTDIGRRWFIRP